MQGTIENTYRYNIKAVTGEPIVITEEDEKFLAFVDFALIIMGIGNFAAYVYLAFLFAASQMPRGWRVWGRRNGGPMALFLV
jgi:hypothetical protein